MAHIFDEITAAYPSLDLSLSSLVRDGASDNQLMAELASHVVDLYETEGVQNIPRAFQLAEQLVTTGSNEERSAAILGFLETVQNVASHRKCGLSSFEQFLGPLSQHAWAELINTWQGKTSLAEVVASETGARLQPHWWQFWKKRNSQSPQEMLAKVENPELRKILEQITRE